MPQCNRGPLSTGALSAGCLHHPHDDNTNGLLVSSDTLPAICSGDSTINDMESDPPSAVVASGATSGLSINLCVDCVSSC